MAENKKSIVVVGDVCIDWFAVPVPRKEGRVQDADPCPNWQLQDGYCMFPSAGGAWLLRDLLSARLADRGDIVVHSQERPELLRDKGCECALHSLVELKSVPTTTSAEDAKSKQGYRWRVHAMRGFAGPATDSKGECRLHEAKDDPGAGIVVLDDVGNGFRSKSDLFPKAVAGGDGSAIIVWKLSRPFTRSPLADELQARQADRLIAIVDVNDLRASGAAISSQLSWERTAGELISALQHDPSFERLKRSKHLLVRLGLEAVVHIADLDSRRPIVHLTYLPSTVEGSTRQRHPGTMIAFNATFTAELVNALARSQGSGLSVQTITAGVRAGINASRALLRDGFAAEWVERSGEPIPAPSGSGGSGRGHVAGIWPGERPEGAKDDEQLVTVDVSVEIGHARPSRLLDYVRDSTMDVLAGSIVLQGAEAVIPKAPTARFGKLLTLDRNEMETYRGIAHLIEEYMQQPMPERPLSIGVFGPPGSGKSFGVYQVASTLGDTEKLEFNMAQFESPEQLTNAFHSVRDAVVRGKVPLVFFDEFDAAVGSNELAWLKHFLAPMQDGKFKDGSSVHLIGKAIFVFAGGTKNTYEEFARIGDSAFRDLKGPDFVSRLRGFINILGTDRLQHDKRPDLDDDVFYVRRAVLMRELLLRKAPALFDQRKALRIDEGVLRAFLYCSSYRHRARSMEAIIDMSRLAGHLHFERSCLPSKAQLALHVDADEFLGLAKLYPSIRAHREQLAQEANWNYHIKVMNPQEVRGMQALWDELTLEHQNDNLDQVDDIPRKLAMIGCGLASASDKEFVFADTELELLSRAEHDRWCLNKKKNNYVYDPGPKDPSRRSHPAMLPWADLPEKERNKDVDAIKAMPSMLRTKGLSIVRLGGHPQL